MTTHTGARRRRYHRGKDSAVTPHQTIKFAKQGWLNLSTADRTAAAVIWLFGAYFSASAVAQSGIPWNWATVTASAIQAILTILQLNLTRNRSRALPFGSLVVDALLNAAGLYGFMLNLPATDLWGMLTDVANEYGATLKYSPTTALGLALFTGVVIARAPEYLWRRDGGTR